MESDLMTLVGLRMTTAGEHHATASTVGLFTECLAAYFNGWEESSRQLSWEIIYVQHADSTAINGWRRRGVVNPKSVGNDESREIAAFWKEKARQYQVSISYRDFGGEEAHRTVEGPPKQKNKLGRERSSCDFW
ncbi:retrotransposon hot spot (RHS) protein [Trypanosoma cruzi]|nr:retrotransposon hot spot (RHS) protein [Trypanosoma cruzi]